MPARMFERCVAAVSTLAVLVCLFLPLFVLHASAAGSRGSAGPGREEVTVGIAVILRATVRRFMRTASNSLMRTAFSVIGRASARAATRRVVKAATKVTVGMILQRTGAEAEGKELGEPVGTQSALVALTAGFVALALSFWGIMAMVPATVVSSLLHDGRIGMLLACCYVAAPLLVYAVFHQVFGSWFGVKITYRTELEGLVLQGYFTGSGSFLPMTTDVEYTGSDRGNCLVATSALLAMLAVHVACMLVAQRTGSEHLEFLGAAFLIYAFIYVFPIRPLEGTFIWRSSKLLWLLVAGPILAAFLFFLPTSFGDIL